MPPRTRYRRSLRAEEREGVVHLMIPDGMGYPVTAGPRDAVKRGNPDI